MRIVFLNAVGCFKIQSIFIVLKMFLNIAVEHFNAVDVINAPGRKLENLQRVTAQELKLKNKIYTY